MNYLRPLKGVRVWLSGSISPEVDGEAADGFRTFVARLSELIFRAGGSIIHGCDPSIVPLLLASAANYQSAQGSRDCLVLAASKLYADSYAKSLDDWRAKSIVHEVPAIPQDQAESMAQLRQWIADRSDAIISVGGRRWKENPGSAGVPQEFELARERGLPGFLLAGLGGAGAGYLQMRPELIRNLKNGLNERENLKFATELNVEALATDVVDQLCRLPLVRGPAMSDATFRILSLDGGGIKGTFTAAVLAQWEETIGCRLTDHFDLIAGTSPGGILAVGLGMGLTATDMLTFYEKRGPAVFPITSLGRKWSHGLTQLVKPKYAQAVLHRELTAAFAQAPGKTIQDSLCRLVIPAVHARAGSVHLFRTNHHPDLLAHKNASAIEVALATAAAPTYFRAAEIDDSAYVDGGVWANNPTLAALTEATSRLRVPLNHIDILNVGTTSAPYSGRKTFDAGYAGWLWRGRIIELLMHAQAQGVIELSSSLAGRTRLLRVDETLLPGEISLDNIDRILDLKDFGRTAAGKADLLGDVKARFLNGIPVEPWRKH